MDLESLKGFDDVVGKVTADLKMLKELSEEAKNFNSFPNDIPFSAILAELKDHVKACLSAHDLFAVLHMSKDAMKDYSELNFDIRLLP